MEQFIIMILIVNTQNNDYQERRVHVPIGFDKRDNYV